MKLRYSLGKHCLTFTTFRVLGFLVVLGEEKREKENKHPTDEINKHPTDEMLAVLTHFGRKNTVIRRKEIRQ